MIPIKLEARGVVTGSPRTLEQRVLKKGMLSKGATYEIIVTGRIGAKEIDVLIRNLEIDKELLADDEDHSDIA